MRKKKLPIDRVFPPESKTIVPTAEEVDNMANEALVLASEGRNPYPGSTYIDGVSAALGWVTGERDEPPLEL